MRALVRLVILVATADLCAGCGSADDGNGSSLPDYWPDGGPDCIELATASGTCPDGAFCMEVAFTGRFVCKRFPAPCASEQTCNCLVQHRAYDCPRDLWACSLNDGGIATAMVCLAN